MNVIYWNTNKKKEAWITAGKWMQQTQTYTQNGAGPIVPYVPDAIVLAEPNPTIPTAIYGGGRRSLVQLGGSLNETAATPGPNQNMWCLRQFDVGSGTGRDQEVMYVLWNNRNCAVTSNIVVNNYMVGPGHRGQSSRMPVAMVFTSRPPPPQLPVARLVAAVHLSPHANEASTTLIQWCQALVAARAHNAAFNIGTIFGDFNLPPTTAMAPFALVTPANALSSIDRQNTFRTPTIDWVAADPGLIMPAPVAGRVYGFLPPNNLASDLHPVPPGFGLLASDHVPIYVTL